MKTKETILKEIFEEDSKNLRILHDNKLKSVSFKDLPKRCRCGNWDIDSSQYSYDPYVGIQVVDVPKCRSSKEFNSLGIGEACFDGIEYQGFGVKHYVDYERGFGNSEGCCMTTGFYMGTMGALLDHVTCGSEIYLHFEYLSNCECETEPKKSVLRSPWDMDYNEGFKQKIWFENGYGISLVYHSGSYGLECALIHGDIKGLITNSKKFNSFCGGDNVRGYLSGDDLSEALNIVKNLKKRE